MEGGLIRTAELAEEKWVTWRAPVVESEDEKDQELLEKDIDIREGEETPEKAEDETTELEVYEMTGSEHDETKGDSKNTDADDQLDLDNHNEQGGGN